jgi:lipopolysaccharide biosynthesis protein
MMRPQRVGALGVPARDDLRALKPIGCLVHLYYFELWPLLLRHLRRFHPIPTKLYVNIVARGGAEEKMRARVLRSLPDAIVRISPNRGRDIGGFFALKDAVAFDDHDILCLLHTKRSPHAGAWFGGRWTKELLRPILGTRRVAAAQVEAMRRDPGVGIVAASRWRRTSLPIDPRRYHELRRRLALAPGDRMCEYVGGTMMLVRAAIMRELFETYHDVEFEPEHSIPAALRHLDWQTAHALERLIGDVVRKQHLRFAWC